MCQEVYGMLESELWTWHTGLDVEHRASAGRTAEGLRCFRKE
jgi:hypothetical protein